MRQGVEPFDDDITTLDNYIDETNLRCLVSKCEGVKFSSVKDLKRHAKNHNPGSTLWKCGCCQNLGILFEGKSRKDKVQAHLRSKHETSRSEDKNNLGFPCPAQDCYNLFTTLSCLDLHFKYHPTHAGDLSNQPSNGRCIIPTHPW